MKIDFHMAHRIPSMKRLIFGLIHTVGMRHCLLVVDWPFGWVISEVCLPFLAYFQRQMMHAQTDFAAREAVGFRSLNRIEWSFYNRRIGEIETGRHDDGKRKIQFTSKLL